MLEKLSLAIKNKHIIILIFISTIFAYPLLSGFHQNHDNTTHLARAAQYILAISDFQIPPRWAPTINYGYGSPFFIFFYPLCGYAIALLSLLGLKLETSYLLFSYVIFVSGPVGFYLWTQKLFKKETAFLASIIYIILPYRFLTLYVRGGLGEFLAYSLVPFFFFALKYCKTKKIPIIAGIVFSLIVLSHNAVSLMIMPVILAYSVLYGKKMVKTALISILIGLFLSAYFWIPSLLETRYTQFHYYFGNMYRDHFPNFLSLFYSPWGFGPDVNKSQGLSAQVGIFATVIFLFTLLSLFKKGAQQTRKMVIFWAIVFVAGIFLSSRLSEFIWNASDFLKRFQFPWRFMMLSSFAAASLSPYFVENLKNKKVLLTIIFVFVVFSFQYAKVDNKISYPDRFYYNYPGSTSFHGETTTVWTAGDPSKKAVKQIETVGKAKIKNIRKRTLLHEFTVDALEPTLVVDNTIYFPGWKTFVDGKEQIIEFQNPKYRGLITFEVSKGKHLVKVVFGQTKTRLVSDMISAISFLLIAILLLFRLRFKLHPDSKKNL